MMLTQQTPQSIYLYNHAQPIRDARAFVFALKKHLLWWLVQNTSCELGAKDMQLNFMGLF